ncbi:MAG: PKD domain-containing protein, partial [Bacteroidetes bacterium]|nr:PKD domain-containing protein [Bacteroidota bacterium]
MFNLLISRNKETKSFFITFLNPVKYIILLFFIIGFQQLFSQVMVSPTGKPNALIICEGDSTFSLLIANTTGGTMSGATLLLDLPADCQYIPASISGAAELDISNLNQPTFSIPGIANNTAHDVEYNAEIGCGYDNTEDFNYIVNYNNSNYTGTDGPLQNYYFPSVVITNITNSSATVQVNQSVTRDFTIEQQGLNASLDTLIILDEHTSDIEVLSVNIGTLIIDMGTGPIFVDTIIITGSDMPGGNNRFDYGEIIILSETVKLVGCTNGQSTITATWGCNNEYCDSYLAFPSVSPASGVPLIDINFTGNQLGWGFIDNSGFIEFTVTNNGSGAGIAFDLVSLAGFASGGNTYYPNNDWLNEIDSFSVNGNYLTAQYNYAAGAINGQYAYYFNYAFTFDPDGPGVGIEDVDGDGIFDDLPIGNTVTVKAHTYYNWPEALAEIPAGNSCGRGWTNNSWQGFRYGYDFTDQCSAQPGATWVPNSYVTLFMTYNTNTLQHTIPPDIYEGSTVWMEQEVVTNTKVEDEGCPNDSVIYRVVLPAGISISTGTATFKNVSMGSPTIIGDTVIYFLDKNRVKSGGWFRVPLEVDCDVQHAPTGTIQTNLKFWCDKTDFPSRFFTYWCSESPVFGIQCPAGSCSDPYISYFSVERTTMGWTDNQLSQKVDPSTSGIHLDYALARDSILIETVGILNESADSLYFLLSHDNLPGNWSDHLFFDYISDTLYFFDFETEVWYTCSNLNPNITNSNTSSITLNFSNLTLSGGCLEGINLTAGDSLRYIIYGQVRNIARTNWETVPAFRARFHNVELGNENYCNDRGITFNILGSNYVYVDNTFINPTIIEGCDDLYFYGQVYRWLDACGGEIAFPNEIRPYVVLDSMTFSIPEGYIYHPGSAIHQYRDIDGVLVFEPLADPLINYGANETRLVFIRDASWSYSNYYDCNADQDRIQFIATPSCQTSPTISYKILTTGRYQYYVDGIGINQSDSAIANKAYLPANVVLTPLITTAEGRFDTVSWEIRLCNTTNIDADNNWLAFENESEGIDILELIDITTPSSPISIPVAEYSPSKSWGQLGTHDADVCKIYLVKAIYSSCSYDSVLVRHSFNCAGYPVNPELGYPPTAYSCYENNTYIFLDPKDVSLNLLVTSPVNPVVLCDTLTYEAEVTNTLLSYGYDLSLTITVPPGVSFIPSTSEFKYPYTTGNYQLINDPVNLPAGSNKWVFDISSDPNGTPLLKGVDSLPMNGYNLKFKIMTDCNLISGSSLKFDASASNACGDEKTRSSFTSPIIIDGLPTNVNLYVLNTENDPYLPTCNGTSTIKVKVINLGPNSVSNIEMLSVSIDDAYDYVPGSLVPIHNGPSGISNNMVIGGIRYLHFSILPNLNINDSIVFTYDLIDIDPGSLECDTIPLTTSAMLVATVPCDNEPGGSCLIQSITTSINTNLAIRKDNVEFGSYFTMSSPDGSTAELVNINYSIRNSGEYTFTSDSLDVVFVHDANGNGLADDFGADSLFYQRLGVENLPIGDSIVSTAIFSASSDKICNMLAAIRLSEDTCICAETILTISDIHLINTGPDTMVCIQQPLQIGTDSIEGQTYIWVPSNYLSSSTYSNPEFIYTGSLSQSDTLTYMLITTRPGGCINRDTLEIIVYPHASAYAGSDEQICETFPFDFSTCSIVPNVSNYDSLLWYGGTGIFNIPDTLFPVYTPGIDEVGPVELFLVAYSKLNCSQDISSMILTFDTLPDPTIAYIPDTSICVNETIYFSGFNSNSTNIISWLWNFGDGNTTNGQSPTHAYLQNGTYNVSLSLTNNYGCIDSVFVIIVVNELPQAFFNVSPADTSCANLPVNFNGGSTTNIINWEWDFGDNTTGSGQNISHTYNTSGSYIVDLIVENNNTCSDTVIDSVFVRQLPLASFTMTPQDTSCLNDTVYFEGFSFDNIISWHWYFGDAGTDSVQNVSHVYTQPGNYEVSLIFEDDNGCSDTITNPVNVRQPPVADFLISPADTSCVDETIYFNGNSLDNIVSWEWDFGDGGTASGQNVSYDYIQAGTYTILLIFTNDMGCTDTVIHEKIITDPFINFNINPNPICLGYSTNFYSTGDNVTYADYLWDFGDGIGTAIGQNVNYLYSSPDTYNVSLQVCSKNVQQSITVNPVCTVDAGGNQSTCQDVYFNYSTSATPPTAEGVSAVYWYTTGIGVFNDPTLVAPTYFPDSTEGAIQNDTILMTMIGYGIPPCENDTSQMELIIIPGAYAQAGSDENSCIGFPYDFANSTDSAFATHYATLYWLTSGTGYFVDPNVQQPIYIPGLNEIGPITLTMVASNIINCDSIDHMTLTIRPEYSMPFDTTVCFYDSVFAQGAWHYASGTFYDTLQSAYGCDSLIITNLTVRPKVDKDFTMSTGDSICLGETTFFSQIGTASLASWLWDFGDGNFSTDINPSHAYGSSGFFDVIFYYTDVSGCSDSTMRPVWVFELPDVSFTTDTYNACVNTPINFTGLSSSNIVLWYWDFGDGQTGTGQNPSHIYATWGNMMVSLTVTDINGCSETSHQSLIIVQSPIADFTYNIVICDSIQFTDLSTCPPGFNLVMWHWDFDDGDISNLQNPIHTFPSNTVPGGVTYNVNLIVTADSNGFLCTNSVTHPVLVPSNPDIFFTWFPEPTCLGESTYFYGESGYPISQWHWYFDDGHFATTQSPVHLFDTIGSYSVVLIIADTNGCVNTLSNIITVNPAPE